MKALMLCALCALSAGGCYSRSVKYEGLEVQSYGLFLDREVNASLERGADGLMKIAYHARDSVDPALAATVDAAVRAAIEGAVRGLKPTP